MPFRIEQGDAGAGTLSGKHANHVNNAAIIGTNFACAACHSATVSSGSAAISDPTKHVNQTKDVVIAAAYSGSGNCGTYCHTNGRGGAPNTSVTWSGPAIDCNGCHSAIVTTGSHPKHAAAAADCDYTTLIGRIVELAMARSRPPRRGQTQRRNASRTRKDNRRTAAKT